MFRKLLKKTAAHELKIPKTIGRIVSAFVLFGSIFFMVIEGLIINGALKTPPKDLDYLIVLGAGLRGDKPSLTLSYRLDLAYDYLMQNEHTKVLVSGGQGFDEPVTEAFAMEKYLLDKGIEKNRILKEETSTSTYENLKFSKELFKEQESIPDSLKIGIVSNDFHIYRALHLAKELSYQNVYGCGAKSVGWLIPCNYIREAFAVVKDCIL